MHGQGAYTYADGDKYVGEFNNDFFEGQGTYYFKDGSKNVGEFKNDLLNGYGIQYRADGSIINNGIFKEGKFVD